METKLDQLAGHMIEAARLVNELAKGKDDSWEAMNKIMQIFGETAEVECVVHVFWPLLGDPDTMTEKDKITAIKVVGVIGPDYLNKFRRFGKFMAESETA